MRFKVQVDIYSPTGPNTCVYEHTIFISVEADTAEEAAAIVENQMRLDNPGIILTAKTVEDA